MIVVNIQFVPVSMTYKQREKLKIKKLELSFKLKKDLTYGDVIDYLLKK